MDEAVTIYDIAKACHVSIATVSRVLNENPKVSAKTKELVLAKMKELQYNPNPFARGISSHSMKLIGILCRRIEDYGTGLAISHLTQAMQHAGYGTLLWCCHGEDDEEILTQCRQKHVDGLFLLGMPFSRDEAYDELATYSAALPLLAIGGALPGDAGYAITSTIDHSWRQLLTKFAKSGLRRPLLLLDDTYYLKAPEIASYRRIGKAFFQSGTAKSIIALPSAPTAQAQRLSKVLATHEPDVVIAATDTLALTVQAYTAAQASPLPLVSLVDSPAMAYAGITSLTTPIITQCQTAAQHMLHLLTTSDGAVPIRLEFKASWTYRSSFPEEA